MGRIICLRSLIGNSGHIAFTGIADTSVELIDTSQFYRTLWFGKVNQLNIVAKKGHSVIGLTEQMTIEDIGNSLNSNVIISDSGSIAFRANISSGDNYHQAILVATGEVISTAIVEGQTIATGFPEGTFIKHVGKYLFTDAGMAIVGTTNTDKSAIWFWKEQHLQLVIAEGEGISNFYPGCSPFNFRYPTLLMDINKRGKILFVASFVPNTSETACPVWSLFTWKSGVFNKIVAENDSPPTVHLSPRVGPHQLIGPTLNDKGDISYELFGTKWFVSKNEEPSPVLFYGESIPALPQRSLNSSHITQNSIATNINEISIVRTSDTRRAKALLIGEPKQNFSYPEVISDLSNTHLSLLYSNELLPNHFAENTSFYQLGDSIGINNLNTVIFEANLDNRVQNSIWRSDLNSNLKPLVSENIPVMIDRESIVLTDVHFRVKHNSNNGVNSTNGGHAKSLNDLNQFIFLGKKSEHSDYAIFYYEENDCIATYLADSSLRIPCVRLLADPTNTLYQATLQLEPYSSPISFLLFNVQEKDTDITNSHCTAIYQANGQLNLPCINVYDALGKAVMYMVNLKLAPSKNPLTFELTQAQRK